MRPEIEEAGVWDPRLLKDNGNGYINKSQTPYPSFSSDASTRPQRAQPRAAGGQARLEPRRPDPKIVEAKRREIDSECKRANRAKPKAPAAKRKMRFRRGELKRLYYARFGRTLPENPMGRDCAYILAQTIAPLCGNTSAVVLAIEFWCPWMACGEAEALAESVIAEPQLWDADTLGQRLNLTDAERTALAIRTIGAVDVGKAQRLARRRKRDRLTQAAKRRAAGATPRNMSASRTKPWDEFRVCRRTWERRGKPDPYHAVAKAAA